MRPPRRVMNPHHVEHGRRPLLRPSQAIYYRTKLEYRQPAAAAADARRKLRLGRSRLVHRSMALLSFRWRRPVSQVARQREQVSSENQAHAR
jgi:hypothetical protein